MRNYHTDAQKISEFQMWMDDRMSTDWRAKSQKEMVREARYILDCYFEDGHTLNSQRLGETDLVGDNDKRRAARNIRGLRSYIKRYAA